MWISDSGVGNLWSLKVTDVEIKFGYSLSCENGCGGFSLFFVPGVDNLCCLKLTTMDWRSNLVVC